MLACQFNKLLLLGEVSGYISVIGNFKTHCNRMNQTKKFSFIETYKNPGKF
jgi:hypothetical protein